MGTPTLTLMFDRRKRASKTKEGSIELRITFNRVKRYVTTGVRVFPREWKNGAVVNRLDAYELQRTLDQFVAHARKVINDLMERGELDMQTTRQRPIASLTAYPTPSLTGDWRTTRERTAVLSTIPTLIFLQAAINVHSISQISKTK